MKPLILIVLSGLATGLFAQGSGQAQKTQEDYMKLMRSDLRREKASIVDQAMGLEASQKAKFYTVYSAYEKELSALFDKRFNDIKTYAANYPDVSDAVADQLVAAAMANQAARADLWKKYYPQMKAALGSKVAARFLQVENTLAQMIDLQLSAELPLIP